MTPLNRDTVVARVLRLMCVWCGPPLSPKEVSTLIGLDAAHVNTVNAALLRLYRAGELRHHMRGRYAKDAPS